MTIAGDKEFETTADIDGERLAVVVYYELDGYKPIINNICILGTDSDIIDELYMDEFDRIYADLWYGACQRIFVDLCGFHLPYLRMVFSC